VKRSGRLSGPLDGTEEHDPYTSSAWENEGCLPALGPGLKAAVGEESRAPK